MLNYCRFCAAKSENLQNPHQPIGRHNKSPSSMLSVFSGLNISDGNGLPKFICLLCSEDLQNAYEFYIRFKEAQDDLLQLILQKQCNKYTKILPKIEESGRQSPIAMPPSKVSNEKPKRRYKCLECPLVFTSHRSLKVHGKDHINESICNYCNVAQIRPDEMDMHLEKNHQNRKFTCRVCCVDRKEFATKYLLLNHFKTIHNIVETPFFCPDCPTDQFDEASKLLDHMRTIHSPIAAISNVMESDDFYMDEEFLDEFLDKSSFQFNECWDELGLPFDAIGDCQQELVLDDQNMKTYKCPQCPQDFQRQNKMILHLADEHGEFALACNVCGDKFNKSVDFSLHRKTHVRQPRPSGDMQCYLCDKSFKTRQGLRYHIETHSNDKMQRCFYCDRTFLTSLNLRAHIKAKHAALKLHVCSLCDRKFATLDHLKKHVMSFHQRERNFLCTICGKSFSQMSHLKKHSIIHQSDDTIMGTTDEFIKEAKVVTQDQ